MRRVRLYLLLRPAFSTLTRAGWSRRYRLSAIQNKREQSRVWSGSCENRNILLAIQPVCYRRHYAAAEIHFPELLARGRVLRVTALKH